LLLVCAAWLCVRVLWLGGCLPLLSFPAGCTGCSSFSFFVGEVPLLLGFCVLLGVLLLYL
jgi:hypothetical protein